MRDGPDDIDNKIVHVHTNNVNANSVLLIPNTGHN